MTRRTTSDEERKLFEQTFKEGRPIKAVTPKKPAKRKAAATGPSGINGATQERLRRGLVEPDARIDLHGMTQAQAHGELAHFLRGAQARGAKFVLVITGKGKVGGAESERGVLRRQVPQWLSLPEFRTLVVGFEEAHIGHGGEGALYVRVRRLRV